MKCSECGEKEAVHHVDAWTKKNPKKVCVGAVCSKYCELVLMERVHRWPETYITSKQK